MACVDGASPHGNDDIPTESFQYECDPCKFEEKVTEATGYCSNCKEYLCGQCQKDHRKFTATRDHTTLASEDMPNPYWSKASIQHCDLHSEAIVEFYCKEHNSVLCNICKSMQHMRCSDVKPLDEVSGGANHGNEIHNVIQRMTAIHGQLDLLKRSQKSDLASTNSRKDKCQKDIATLRKTIGDLLDKLETNLYTELDKKHKMETSKFKDIIQTVGSIMAQLMSTIRAVQGAAEQDDIAVFTAMKKSEKLITEYEEYISAIQQEAFTQHFIFQPEQEVTDVLNKLTKLGTINFQQINSSGQPVPQGKAAPTEFDYPYNVIRPRFKMKKIRSNVL